MDYFDFELEIGPGSGKEYPISVVHSPAGEARETMRFPYDDLALENRLLTLQKALLSSGGKRRQILTSDEQTVNEFGKSLFDSILKGEVRSRYDVSMREAEQHGKGLRLKLRIQPPELAALPWEFLYDSRQADYISLSNKTPLVRYLELPQPIQPLTIEPPLHILGMIASPSDLPLLDVQREKQRVEEALKSLKERGLVDIIWMEGQTWENLQQTMRIGTWHIFHFIGHGGFDRNTDEGLIALADKDGQTFHLSATQLGRFLAGHSHLRLVLLNSCEGALGSKRDIFSSTASILVRRGIPAVLAMQYEITDKAAIEFARAFYLALSDGMPVDAAVAEARIAISVALTNTIEWGTPVLFMRSPDGVLFNIKKKGKEGPAPQEPIILSELKKAEDYYSSGASYANKGEHDRAIEAYTRAIELDLNKAEYYYSRGMSYAKKGEDEKAINDYNRAIQLESDKADYYFERAMSYSKRDHDKAIANFNRAIQFDPKKAKYHFERGKNYGWKGEYDKAIENFNTAIQLEPNNVDYYWERGVSYATKGYNEEAIVDFNKAIEFNPNRADYYYARGVCYANKGDHDKAIADYNDAIVLDSTNSDYYFELGYCYANKRSFDEAIDNFNRAIELNQNKAEYYYSRCLIHACKSDHGKAIEDFKRAIQVDLNKENLLLLLRSLR